LFIAFDGFLSKQLALWNVIGQMLDYELVEVMDVSETIALWVVT